MSLSSVLAQLLNGLAGASALFLVAAGLSLIFGVTRIVNFAHGSFYMLGIYVAYTVVARIGGTMFGFWASILIAALAVFAVIPFGSVIPPVPGVQEPIRLVVAPGLDVGMIYVFALSSIAKSFWSTSSRVQ